LQASPACAKTSKTTWITGRVASGSNAVKFGTRAEAVKFTFKTATPLDDIHLREPDFITTMSFSKGRKGGEAMMITSGQYCSDYVHIHYPSKQDNQNWGFYEAGLPEAEG
jgi:hypothetical protein